MTKQMDTNIFNYIQQNISVLDVAKKFPEFYQSLVKTGHDYGTMCPTGHPSKSGTSFKLVYDGEQKDFYFCHSCGISGGAFNLAQLLLEIHNEYTEVSIKDTINWFVNTFSLPKDFLLFKSTKTPEQIAYEKKLISDTILYEELIKIGKKLLFEEPGKEALAYLTQNRKYSIENIKQTDFFYLLPTYEARKYLSSVYPELQEEINSLSLNGHLGDLFRLALPYKISKGRITGLLKRATSPNGISGVDASGVEFKEQRWDSTAGLRKSELYGMYRLKAPIDTIFICEGYPDTEYLPTLGFKNVVGLGQAILGVPYIEGLKKLGVKTVILSLDNDAVGPKNTINAIDLLLEHEFFVFVVVPSELGDSKDPDEFVIKNGATALQEVINRAIPGETWRLKQFYQSALTPFEKTNALSSAIEFATKIFSLASKDIYIEELSRLSGIAKSNLNREISKRQHAIVQEKKTKEKTVAESKRKIEKEKEKIKVKASLEDMIQYPLVPFQELLSGSYMVYNQTRSILVNFTTLEKLKNMCADFDVPVPDILPSFEVVFNTQDFNKFNIEQRQINLFTPTKYMLELKPNDKVIDLERDCPTTNFILKNIVASSPEVFEHFINWLAYCFQTRQKTQTAWLFRGKQGVGKNLMFKHIIEPFYGKEASELVDGKSLQDNYNGYMLNKLFIVFNEVAATNNERFSIKDMLKSLITDDTLSINEKFMKRITVTNNINIMFFSNNAIPLVIEASDRRYNVCKTGEALHSMPTYDYYKVSAELEKERNTFYQYLFNYKVNATKANRVIDTPEKQILCSASESQIESYVRALINKNSDWFSVMQTAYSDISGLPKKSVNYPELEEDLKNCRIKKDEAWFLYTAIFSKSNMTLRTFSGLLASYEIELKRVMVNGSRDWYFSWSKSLKL